MLHCALLNMQVQCMEASTVSVVQINVHFNLQGDVASCIVTWSGHVWGEPHLRDLTAIERFSAQGAAASRSPALYSP